MTAKLAAGSAIDRKQLRRQRRWARRLGVASMVAGLAAVGWAFEDAANSNGLKGIFPAAPPAVLSAENFTSLGASWEAWGAGAADAIAEFYKFEGDAAAQKQALTTVKAKLGVLDKALADEKYSMIHEQLIALRGPLSRRVAIADAALTTLHADPEAAKAAAVAASSKEVEQALSNLKSQLNAIPGGNAWIPFIKADVLLTAWGQGASSEAAIAALNTTKSRLAARATLSDESQKAFLSRPAFVALEGAIDTHLAALATSSQPVDLAKTRTSLAELVAALEDYEYSSSAVSAAQVRKVANDLAAVAPDRGAAIDQALNANYYNYNVRIAASEAFLNRLLSDSRVERGQVNDYVLGAAVGGWQTTSSNVTVDVKPSTDRLKFDLVLSGTIQSNTAGRTDQATIYTSGYHTFRSTKEVAYDGSTFVTGPAQTSVSANNTTTGASTRFSGGLFGGMAQRIAMQEAANRRPQSEAIARSRVASNVTPRFNEEVDKSFAKASDQIEGDLAKGLKESGIYPDEQSYSSTASEILIATRLMGDQRLGGFAPESQLTVVGAGAVMAMHESVVNNTIDQIDFSGKRMGEKELRAHVESFLSKALNREFKFQSPAEADAAPATEAAAEDAKEEAGEDNAPAFLNFAKNDPVRILFRDGLMYLVIRAGLEREGGEPIPAHEITVPLRFTVQGDKILISRDALQIIPIEGESKPLQQRVMNTRISNALPDREVSGVFKLRGPSREVPATVTAIRMVDGWIAVNVQ